MSSASDDGLDLNLDGIDLGRVSEPGRPPRPNVPPHVRPHVDKTRKARIRRMLAAIARRRRPALGVFLLVMAATAAYTLTRRPIYEGRARLVIEVVGRYAMPQRPAQEERPNLLDRFRRRQSVLATLDLIEGIGRRELARRTASDMKLPSPQGQDQAARRVLQGLRVARVGNSRLIDIRYRSTDPVQAAAIANGAAASYAALFAESRAGAAKTAVDWLNERLAELKADVDAAERRLQAYRERMGVVSIGTSNDVVERLVDLNEALSVARTARLEKEVLFRQLSDNREDFTVIDAFPVMFKDPAVGAEKSALDALELQEAELAAVLGDRHPDLRSLRAKIDLSRAKLRAHIETVVQASEHEYRAAVAQERQLATALEQQKTTALSVDRAGIEHGLLLADVEGAKRVHDSLQRRAQQIRYARDLRTSGIRLLDRAEPPTVPVGPRHARNMLAGLFAALVLSLALVWLLEFFDASLKTPADLEQFTGLAPLGMLPAIPAGDLHGERPVIGRGAPASFEEAFRQVRTNMVFSMSGGPAGHGVLVVTSAEPGEGKSMAAANAAVALAQAGQTVLLVDADLRRPTVHRIFPCDAEPGLSHVLAGHAAFADCLRPAGVEGLTLLPSGLVAPNPAELLGSRRCAEVLTEAAGRFDWVIVDSPPVMAVADVSLVSQHAAGVVFVIAAGRTSRRRIAQALEQLRLVHARLLGAVLNRVDLRSDPYYYAPYYRPEYASYFAAPARNTSED